MPRLRLIVHISILQLVTYSLPFVIREVRAADALPNVIIVYADDQGYQDLGCFGSPNIKTPNIDRLAAEGMRFTSYYSAYCVCSASRASLMTGCYQPRLNIPGVLGPKSKVGLHPEEVTIADLLKTRGYATQCIGKWHLGDRPETLPTAQGFDHYFGLPYSNDMARKQGWGNDPDDLDKIWSEKKWDIYNNDLLRDEESMESPVDQTTLTDRYTREAVRFIRDHRTSPFFLYCAHTMPHVPLFVSDERYDPDPHKAYQLTIEHVDWSVGQIARTLDELGISENTLIVYTSDNGPWLSKDHHGGSALPLRNGKGTTYEGGMRVPAVMRWPSQIPAGTVTDEIVSSVDLLPTIASLVDADLPPHAIDGLDVSQVLVDPDAASPHQTEGFFYYRNNEIEAVRLGQWKLRNIAKQGKKDSSPSQSAIELFDLNADIGEQTNLAESHPDIVEKLKALAADYDARLKSSSRPVWRAEE